MRDNPAYGALIYLVTAILMGCAYMVALVTLYLSFPGALACAAAPAFAMAAIVFGLYRYRHAGDGDFFGICIPIFLGAIGIVSVACFGLHTSIGTIIGLVFAAAAIWGLYLDLQQLDMFDYFPLRAVFFPVAVCAGALVTMAAGHLFGGAVTLILLIALLIWMKWVAMRTPALPSRRMTRFERRWFYW